jgi:hypothetical protein
MSKRSIKSRAQELLTLGRRLAETPGLTWVEANNAVYGPGGPSRAYFPVPGTVPPLPRRKKAASSTR